METRRLNEQVRRNIKRFPEDFMFRLSKMEFENLKSQIATSSWGGVRKLPLAFTENGVAMLSGVLHSGRAVEVNIQIMRTFTKFRQIALDHKDIWRKIEEMEKKYDDSFKIVFDTLKSILLAGPSKQLQIKGFVKD